AGNGCRANDMHDVSPTTSVERQALDGVVGDRHGRGRTAGEDGSSDPVRGHVVHLTDSVALVVEGQRIVAAGSAMDGQWARDRVQRVSAVADGDDVHDTAEIEGHRSSRGDAQDVDDADGAAGVEGEVLDPRVADRQPTREEPEEKAFAGHLASR